MLVIAEDDPDDQLIIQDAIQQVCRGDVQTQLVWDGNELLDYLREKANEHRQPGLIVLDLNMPRKDGRAALKEIRSDPALREIPVAVLTTSNATRDVEYCQQFGVVGYFRKPGTFEEISKIFEFLCNGYFMS